VQKREAADRLRLLWQACGTPSWTLSGSLDGWGDPLIPRFEFVVFLTAPAGLRVARLRARERAAYGEEALAPGGARYEQHERFLSWAASYDQGNLEGRNLPRHERWLATLSCPVIRITGALPAQVIADHVIQQIEWPSR
jgi:hypothetical protein